ncbi:MAG: chemotaxis protein CheW [Verrucomicrobia bacterium]|nr:chemotaxis protein CheW [Verrucomicrobiota bacterium]
MNPALLPPPFATDFRPGAVALRIRRGNTAILVPRRWVRGVAPVGEVVPLGRAEPWVVGLAVHEGRPVPVLDLATYAGVAATRHPLGVVLGSADQAAVAIALSDAPGRFVSVPAEARLEAGAGWLSRMLGGAQTTWWLEAGRLTEHLQK